MFFLFEEDVAGHKEKNIITQLLMPTRVSAALESSMSPGGLIALVSLPLGGPNLLLSSPQYFRFPDHNLFYYKKVSADKARSKNIPWFTGK